MRELHENFLKISSKWSVILFKKCVKMRCILLSKDNYYSAHQEVIIYEEKESLSYSIRVSIPKIINYRINSDSKITSGEEIIFNHKLINGIEKNQTHQIT